MPYALLADVVVLLHLGFILFVLFGGFLAFRWRKIVWLHLPAFVWGVLIEWTGWMCPLTPLENWLRWREGDATYAGGFIDQYIVPVVYPPGLTRSLQLGLGAGVLILNIMIYVVILHRYRKASRRREP